MASRWSLAVVLTLSSALWSCGPKPAVRFADSAAFRAVAGLVHGILQQDLDGDDLEDAVLAERTSFGFVLAVFAQERSGDGAPRWRPLCRSDVLAGDDLDALRWVSLDRGIVFALVLTENPEEIVQSFALVDVAAGCATRFAETVTVERADGDTTVVPGGLRSGVAVAPSGDRVAILDALTFLRLAGAQADVRVLTGARERLIVREADRLAVHERHRGFLAPVALDAAWRSSAGELALPHLVDDEDRTAFAVRAGEPGRLQFRAEAPFVLLELRHGCGCGPAAPLSIARGAEPPMTLGDRPGRDSFVLGSGAAQEREGVRRDLIALHDPATALDLELGPTDSEHCLRTARAWGFATPEPGP